MFEYLKTDPLAKDPVKANAADAGYDLAAVEAAILQPGAYCKLRTGLKMAIPVGSAGFVWPRSKLASRYGLDVLAGVVDAGYRGEVMVSLINHGSEPVEIRIGDKIARLVIQPITQGGQPIEVETLPDSDRGVRGINDLELRLR